MEGEVSEQEAWRLLGVAQAFNWSQKVAKLPALVSLSQIKSTKAYKKLAKLRQFPSSWEGFCEGVLQTPRRTVDEWLQDLDDFGEELLKARDLLGFPQSSLRLLRGFPANSKPSVDGNHIEIAGQKYPLDPKHADEVREAIDGLVAGLKKEASKALAEKGAIVKGKDREIRGLVNDSEDLLEQLRSLGVDPDGEKQEVRVAVEQAKKLISHGIAKMRAAGKSMNPKIMDELMAFASSAELLEEGAASVRRLIEERKLAGD